MVYEVLLGFPSLDLKIRKMAFLATCRLQSHSSKGCLMDWELVEQLGLQASVVLYRGPKNGFSKSLIWLQLENGVNGQVARMSSLGKD